MSPVFMLHRRFVLLLTFCLLGLTPPLAAKPTPAEVKAAMRKAAGFMVEEVSYRGGYVWAYLPDMSRRWGEMEAKPTMVWVQPPGTATMGHLFLDAYHATGDEYYYRAAEKAAGALIWGQHPSGGWNYMFDFAGEASLKDWYATIGKNGWRLEEFHHYYGNATFDDGGTAEASKLLLRLYLEKLDPKYKPALDQAIQFALNAQYPIGGWPQRYPLRYDHPHHDQTDYTSFITFNDDVAMENIEFLLMCYQALGDTRVIDPIIRAMNSVLVTQQGPPQRGWALQYSLDLKPAGARSYEPKALSTQATVSSIEQLMTFYQLTGETKFLGPIPSALEWLESVRLPATMVDEAGRDFPTFVALGTNKPIFVHRRGSNVVNGEYYVDFDHRHTLSHFRGTRRIPLEQLQQRYHELRNGPVAHYTRHSPLLHPGDAALPKYFTLKEIEASDLNSRGYEPQTDNNTDATTVLLKTLNAQGYWPTPLKVTTNPYLGPGPKTVAPGDYRRTGVGDQWDTSPFFTDKPVEGISVGVFVRNMAELISYLEGTQS